MAKPDIIRMDPRSPEPRRVQRAVKVLRRGGLIALPTDTVYGVGADAMSASAVERLREVKGRASDKPFTLLLADPRDAFGRVSAIPPLAYRLIRSFWPGPLTLILPAPQGGTVGLRVPGHEAARAIIRALGFPLATSSANPAGEPDPLTAEEVLEGLGDRIDAVVDGGPVRFGKPSTVVLVAPERFEILREGAVPREEVHELAYTMVLIVCTGNTCRSAMAGGILKKKLAERTGVAVEDLRAHGFRVESGGTASFGGGAASANAVEALRERGMDIGGHRSQPVKADAVEEADRVWVMTEGHRRSILDYTPEAAPRIELLDPDGGGVADPIGGDLNEYRRTRDLLEGFIDRRLDEILALRQGPHDEGG